MELIETTRDSTVKTALIGLLEQVSQCLVLVIIPWSTPVRLKLEHVNTAHHIG